MLHDRLVMVGRTALPETPVDGEIVYLLNADGEYGRGLWLWNGDEWEDASGEQSSGGPATLPAITPPLAEFPKGGAAIRGNKPTLSVNRTTSFTDIHKRTRWQLKTQAADNWDTPLVNLETSSEELALIVPSTLPDNTNWDWRAIAIGSNGSEVVSETFKFRTGTAISPKAFGSNSNGQLGIGNMPEYPAMPTNIALYSSIVPSKIVAGNYFTFILSTDGTLWATGLNINGQLGLGDTTNRYFFEQVGTDTDWVEVACGSVHTVARKADGSVWVCGNNTANQLGNNLPLIVTRLTRVLNAYSFTHIGAGNNTTFLTRDNGNVWAAGNNSQGQLGLGHNNVVNDFTRVTTLTTIVKFACGGAHTLFLNSTGNLFSAGQNNQGQLGNGTTTNNSAVSNLGGSWLDVASALTTSYGIKSNGVFIWGSAANSAQGTSITSAVSTPTVRVGGSYTKLAAGAYHLLMVSSTNQVFSLGWNSSGQLGNGTVADSNANGIGQGSNIACGYANSFIY